MLAVSAAHRRVRRALIVALVLATAGALAGEASAATVAMTFFAELDRNDPASYDAHVYGTEQDDELRVTQTRAGFEVEDLRAPVTVSGECTALDEHHARCVAHEAYAFTGVHVEGRGGADHLVVEADSDGAHLDGQGGDDRLEVTASPSGATGRVTLVGGPGDDVLLGGAGDDMLVGGLGRDELASGAGDDDVDAGDLAVAGERYDGGAGRDRLAILSTAGAPATLDLAAQALTVPGAAIPVVGFEDASASGARAALLGDDGPNRLLVANAARALVDGRAGADDLTGDGGTIVRGGDGADVLRLVPGDRADGGEGDDWLLGRDENQLIDDGRHGTVLACGAGHDVLSANGLVLAPRDCEHYVADFGWGIRALRLSGRSVRFLLRGNGPCGSLLAARSAGGRPITGHARLRADASSTAWHAVVLPLRRGVRVPSTVTLALTALDRCGREPTEAYISGTLLARLSAPQDR